MPVNGKIIEWKSLELKCSSSGNFSDNSGDGVSSYSHQGLASTSYTPDSGNVLPGFVLSTSSQFSTVGESWGVTYSGPGAPFGWSIVRDGYRNTVTLQVFIRNVKVYVNSDTTFRITWDRVDLYANGSFEGTLPASGGDEFSVGMGPNYIPLLGIPLTLSGSFLLQRTDLPVQVFPGPGRTVKYTHQIDGTVSGGWQFQQPDDVWITLPVLPYSQVGTVTCTNTYNASVSFHHYEDYLFEYAWTLPPGFVYIWRTTTNADNSGGSVVLVPNLSKLISRIGDTYQALWYRGTFPRVTALITHFLQVNDLNPSGGTTTSDIPEIYPSVSNFLGCVGLNTHAIESPFALPTYAPTIEGIGHSNIISYQNGLPPAAPEVFDPTLRPFPRFSGTGFNSTFPNTVSSGGGYMDHFNDLARYLNTWPNPHWQFFFWREDWKVDGSPATWADYWGQIREQWLYNPALPGTEQLRTRNSMILSPLENEQGNLVFLDTYASTLRWIGVSRWQTDTHTLSGSITMSIDRPGSWSSDGCTLTKDSSGLICSNYTKKTVSISLSFGSSSVNPFFLLYLAKNVAVNWDSNVDKMAVEVIGIDGAVTLLGTTPDTYTLSAGSESKYAGSWAIDNGNDQVDDQGTDTLGNGISAEIMAGSEDVLDFQLGKGRSFSRIRFSFTVLDDTVPTTILWPTFGLETDHPTVYWESGKVCDWVWADGPGIRRGQWTFWDIEQDPAFQPSPEVFGLGHPSTIIDWLCFRRMVLEGVDPMTGGLLDLPSELLTLFDSYEGQSPGQVNDFSMGPNLPQGTDGNTNIRAALVNSLSEIPPIACFPTRGRSTSTWEKTQDYAQIVWDQCEQTRHLISPDTTNPSLKDSTDTPIGSLGTAPSGWANWQYNPILDNTEIWGVFGNDKKYAEVRPWHGYFWIGIPRVKGGLHLSRKPTGLMFAVSTQEDKIDILKFSPSKDIDETIPLLKDSSDIGRAQIAYSSDGKLAVIYEKEGIIYYTENWSYGNKDGWSSPVNVAPGQNPALAFDEKFDIGYVAVYATDRWKFYSIIDSSQSGTWQYISDIVTTSTDDSAAGLELSPDGGNQLIFIYKDGDDVKRLYSTNQGMNWSDL